MMDLMTAVVRFGLLLSVVGTNPTSGPTKESGAGLFATSWQPTNQPPCAFRDSTVAYMS